MAVWPRWSRCAAQYDQAFFFAAEDGRNVAQDIQAVRSVVARHIAQRKLLKTYSRGPGIDLAVVQLLSQIVCSATLKGCAGLSPLKWLARQYLHMVHQTVWREGNGLLAKQRWLEANQVDQQNQRDGDLQQRESPLRWHPKTCGHARIPRD